MVRELFVSTVPQPSSEVRLKSKLNGVGHGRVRVSQSQSYSTDLIRSRNALLSGKRDSVLTRVSIASVGCRAASCDAAW